MSRKSKIYIKIKKAVEDNRLKEPFSVSEVNNSCNNLLLSSKSFLSKHRDQNPGNYSVYFDRCKNTKGKYFLIKKD